MTPPDREPLLPDLYHLAVRMADSSQADALLVMLDSTSTWQDVQSENQAPCKVILAADHAAQVEGMENSDTHVVLLDMADSPVYDKISQALLESVAKDYLPPHAHVVVIYSGFEPGQLDSISHVRLDDRLGRLTTADLRQLVTQVPLDTLKVVVDLAVEIGREGREGKAVGTMFVVGNTRRVMAQSRTAGFDPVRGYSRQERNLHDPRVREGVKEIAQLDGAIIVAPDGTVESACRLLESNPVNITLSKGLGARHWAAAAISKTTSAIGVCVSQSTGTVRIFQNGEVMLRIEPLRRAMKWVEFEFEPPEPGERPER